MRRESARAVHAEILLWTGSFFAGTIPGKLTKITNEAGMPIFKRSFEFPATPIGGNLLNH